MTTEAVFNDYRRYITATYAKLPVVFVKGRGSYLWDMRGKKYLDFFPGFGAAGLGHCHPKVVSAINKQSSKLIFIANNFYHPWQAELAKELNNFGFGCKVFYCNSGAEANEAAIKFSRKFGNGRYEIIGFENSFHGRTLAALAATGQKKHQTGFQPMPSGFKIVPFNDLKKVRKAVSGKTAAVILELIQGEGGINVANQSFVRGLRKICEEKNLLLIIDEVQTGLGRTGKFFCYQHYDILPDIITIAKPIAGGLPMGIMAVRKEKADIFGPGDHGSTFGGGPLVCQAALAVLRAIKSEGILNNVKKMGKELHSKLQELKQKHPSAIKEVRGLGLMAGLELNQPGKSVVEGCLKKQFLINCTHERVLRLMPALTVTKKEIAQAFDILDEVLSAA